MNKNCNAIDKIIAELSLRDHKAAMRKLTITQRKNIACGKKTLSDYGGYTLSIETEEALEIKKDYISGKINVILYNYRVK